MNEENENENRLKPPPYTHETQPHIQNGSPNCIYVSRAAWIRARHLVSFSCEHQSPILVRATALTFA